MPELYYYNKLDKDRRQLYHEIYTGLLSMEASFPVTLHDTSSLSEVFLMVRMDHPEIFWASSFSYRYAHGGSTADFLPEYLFKKKQIMEHRGAMEARVKKLCAKAERLSEAEKELYIHNFILENIHYDKLKKPYSHEIIGPLGHGVGVCEGIAKSVKVLCDALGIWCIIVLSEADPEKGIRYRHAWNMVRIGGKTYHLDATFDNTLSGPGFHRYDYFNLSDSFLFRDHEPSIYPVPSCTDSSRAYYCEKKLSFTKQEELEKRIPQYIRKKKPFVFQWRGGFLTKEVFGWITDAIRSSADASGLGIRLSVNWPQAVISAEFTLPEDSGIILQEANEGETVAPS